MKDDPRYCPICDRLLLKRDRSGFVLVIRCDQCKLLIHEKCYLNHHLICNNLIAVVIESEVEEGLNPYTEDLENLG